MFYFDRDPVFDRHMVLCIHTRYVSEISRLTCFCCTPAPTEPSLDPQYFGKLMDEVEEEELNAEEAKERKILRMLLKIKNGTPPQRKTALRQITDKAREFDAGPLFNQILPLLMSPTLEDQERHLLVKVHTCFECPGLWG